MVDDAVCGHEAGCLEPRAVQSPGVGGADRPPAMTVLTIIETVLLVVALVYIVALLRSHADILRRLATLENVSAPRVSPRAAVPAGGDAARPTQISGVTVDGDAVMLSFGERVTGGTAGVPQQRLAPCALRCGRTWPTPARWRAWRTGW